MKVYLAGAIAGCSYEAATQWRDWIWQHPFIEALTNVYMVSGFDYKLDLTPAINLLLKPTQSQIAHQPTEE